MRHIFCDYETFYSTEYSLTKLDPPSYILDALFEAICLGVAEDTGKPYIVDGPDIPRFWNDCDPGVAVISHNQLFDACITNWRFGFTPRLIVDTLAMARTLLGHKLKSVSLRSVAKHLGLPEKGTFLAQARGMTRMDLIASGVWEQYTEYCLNDTELCRMIYLELAPKLPDEEYIVHDMVARCAVEPVLRLNTNVLAEHLTTVLAEKEEMFARAMLAGLEGKSQLMSNNQFADLLKSLGIDPPKKISLATGVPTWAFSRQDRAFMDLAEHDDQRVQAVVEARLGHKSTLEETRTERMLNIATLEFPHLGTGLMPIPLNIGAAITHRLGGAWKLNCQNWGRESPIRRSVEAPEGYVLVASDAAQIEARFTAWFSGQWDMVDQFAQGLDVYALFATTVFGYPVNKKDHPGPRFIGKTGVLQLGYQSGWPKFQATVYNLSVKEMGRAIEISDEDAQRVVQTYRSVTAWAVSQMWQTLHGYIAWMANAGENEARVMGPVTFSRNKITGPNGLCLHYDGLDWDPVNQEWRYSYGGQEYKLYGGKLLENIIQFLARCAIMQAAVQIRRRLAGLDVRFVHQAHDELVYLVRQDLAHLVAAVLAEEMSRVPKWAPRLPLKGETKMGQSYGTMTEVKAL